ncbi:RecBCD enzyme subunit RecD [Buchnera aphidicola (Cinara kochiana kochiana)]|uniref:RecBCD enzyme subunit RecD n=1 Tax=Buchnera aphidicola (Cinara kochiana kochiana) TaxID=2518976 RepID=A0A451D5Y2_9GAMM|nr:exodeoxyribonuclease V subunit alpha [Buchnera aphidicola]VFP81197.1 RecBCD enzyme subunit RecD [Buchnera aphidicola (Cinara kochiana kochiana)]
MTPKNKKKFFKIIHDAKLKNIISCIDFYFCFNKNFSNTAPEVLFVLLFLSYLAYYGHSCMPIHEFKNNNYLIKKNKIFYKLFQLISNANKNDWFNTVINDILCSNGTQKTPLVLEKKLIYIYKYWYIENKIIEFIRHQKLKNNLNNLNKYKKLIKKYCFKKIDNIQKTTIQNALLNHIFFIIGGPGTGKTSILAYFILILIKSTKKKINIQLSAPTGKAATKLTQSVYYILYKENINKKNTLSFPKKGITLHNLFKIKKETNQCNLQNKKIYKNLDILIIDECSMLDLNLMNIIIDNIYKKTKIIFVGDINQLPSIEIGSVLKNICHNTYKKSHTVIKKNKYNKKKDKIVYKYIAILKKKYRFKKNSGINYLTDNLENYYFNDISIFYQKKYTDIKWKSLQTQKNYLYLLKKIKKYSYKYNKFVQNNYNPKKIIKKFNKYQILCAVNKGIFGTKEINKIIDKWFIQNQKIKFKKNIINKKKESFYHGKPILIKKNNITLQVMNGDIGICLFIKNKFKVFFVLPDKTIKIIDPQIILHYESAWAITIHKSQGSEYSSVNIIIPNYFSSLLSRELLYTAVTRAKKKITIYANKKIINFMLKNKNITYSGLIKAIKLI